MHQKKYVVGSVQGPVFKDESSSKQRTRHSALFTTTYKSVVIGSKCDQWRSNIIDKLALKEELYKAAYYPEATAIILFVLVLQYRAIYWVSQWILPLVNSTLNSRILAPTWFSWKTCGKPWFLMVPFKIEAHLNNVSRGSTSFCLDSCLKAFFCNVWLCHNLEVLKPTFTNFLAASWIRPLYGIMWCCVPKKWVIICWIVREQTERRPA